MRLPGSVVQVKWVRIGAELSSMLNVGLLNRGLCVGTCRIATIVVCLIATLGVELQVGVYIGRRIRLLLIVIVLVLICRNTGSVVVIGCCLILSILLLVLVAIIVLGLLR